jgi:hypothetical protein
MPSHDPFKSLASWKQADDDFIKSLAGAESAVRETVNPSKERDAAEERLEELSKQWQAHRTLGPKLADKEIANSQAGAALEAQVAELGIHVRRLTDLTKQISDINAVLATLEQVVKTAAKLPPLFGALAL